jgi:RNA polymerase sigma factor (sigma-70 family)
LRIAAVWHKYDAAHYGGPGKEQSGGRMVAEIADVRALVHRPRGVTREHEALRAERRAELVEALFRRHRCSLLWYLMRLVPNRADAEEIAQEAFLRLLGAEHLETDPSRARSYLFTAATNLAHDHYRRKTARADGAHVTLDDLQIEADDPGPERLVDGERGKRIVDAALRDLNPRPRQAFLLYVQDDLTYECIALQLGVSKKTIERDMALTIALCRSRLTRWKEA